MDAAVVMTDTAVVEEDVTVTCYVNEIPAFVESELARLYGSLHSSLQYFRVFRSISNASCYVARRDGLPIAILVFHVNNGRIEVLNEMLELEQEELRRFVRHVFKAFPDAGVISFKALKADTDALGLPMQRSNAKDTYMISLPATAEEYTAKLGKSTRSTLRHQLNKIVRDYPSFTSSFYVKDEIQEEHVREIIKFNEERITSKAYKFSHDDRRILDLAKTCGYVSVITIDGRICAGTVNYRIGDSIFGDVIGYDTEYEKSGVGKVALYLTICESIARGARNFYLGGGRFDFKSRMLGVQLHMDRIEIYRSYGSLLLNFDKVASTAFNGYLRRVKVWLHENQDKAFAKMIFNSFYFWKNLRNK
ncbi:acetyltransferase (GNAT) family protein [Paucimonas lemoignei]|uniref:Acetyltransferase (GNAT) family protein n=1 Tax=Paucimonas lemoignei TaxID=29443 RepID=A0A4V2UI79_PAULE|nr:GNAT family N-acetyltransferase [Paucimonas lemoignei]TCS34311.1 acetyltransferase (GNAT) family protein [Paucimonas lemoignei]